MKDPHLYITVMKITGGCGAEASYTEPQGYKWVDSGWPDSGRAVM